MHKQIKTISGRFGVPFLLLAGFLLTQSGRLHAEDEKLPELPPAGAFDEMFKDEGWEQLANEPTIKTWRKQVPGSPLFAFRGEAIIDASIPKIAQVLSDTSRKTEWVHKSVEAKNIRMISDLERIEYNHTSTPFPLTDRDFVFHEIGRAHV